MLETQHEPREEDAGDRTEGTGQDFGQDPNTEQS